jgi:hypothetical protein
VTASGQRHAGGRGHSLAGPMRRLAWRLSERRLDRADDKRAGGDGRRPAFFVVTQQAGDTFTYEPSSTAPYGDVKPRQISSSLPQRFVGQK